MTTTTPIYRVDEEYRRRVAHIIRTQRKAAGLNQKALAEAAGVHVAYLSRVERGDDHYTYHDEMFVRLAEALGLNVALVRPPVVAPVKATPPPAPVPLWTEPGPDVPVVTPGTQEIVIAGGTRIVLTIQVLPGEKETA